MRTLNGADDNTVKQVITPSPRDSPRDVVAKFLAASVDADDLHQEAKQFLVPRTSWNSSTVTIVDGYRVGNPDHSSVSVSGQIIGTLDATGAYSPAAQTTTSTVAEHSFPFKMARTANGWRISKPPVGLIMGKNDFPKYRQRQVYFFNQAETKLVPELRYTPAQGQSLATWLATQLLAGPQGSGQTTAVRHNEIPSELDTARVKVTLEASDVVIQLPGICQSDAPTITRVAAELAYTLFPAFLRPLKLTDLSGPAPGVPEHFDTSTYPWYAPLDVRSAQQLFYLRDGALIDSTNRAVAGPLGSNRYDLDSVAVGDLAAGDRPVAAVGAGGKRLVIGSLAGPVHQLALPAAATSRPDWASDRAGEVWLGTGSTLVRVVGSKINAISYTAAQGVALPGRAVTSVRFSPEGARVAIVLSTRDTSAVWIGQVSRSGANVQIVDMRQITAQNWYVTDVAWTDAVQLRLIDSAPTASDFIIRAVQVDGLEAVATPAGNLPGAPQYITAQLSESPYGGLTWVSVGATLWHDPGGGDWTGQTPDGEAPVYSR